MVSTLPKSLRIGVIRGGPVHHNRSYVNYASSIKSGGYALNHLDSYRPIDIFISRDGQWHMKGLERSPEKVLKNVDVVFSTLDDGHVEDVNLHQLLNYHGVPYVGSDKFSSSFSKNRKLAKEKVFASGVKTALYTIIEQGKDAFAKSKEIFNSISHPFLVRPMIGSGSFGSKVVNSFEEMVSYLEELLVFYPKVLVEQHISGKNFSCLVLEDFRGKSLYVFPPVSTLKEEDPISLEEMKNIEEAASKIHDSLGFTHYSQSDFIVAQRRGIYFSEAKSHPEFSEKSSAVRSLQSVGVSPRQFFEHLIYLALRDKSLK